MPNTEKELTKYLLNLLKLVLDSEEESKCMGALLLGGLFI